MRAPAFTPEPFETDADCATLCIRRVSSRRIPKWRKLEFDLITSVRANNPFDPNQIEITVRFTSPQGDVMEVPAFFYSHEGQQGWRARFSPTVEGEWRAQPWLRKPFAFAGETVTFQVAPPLPDSHGFLRLDRRNPRYLPR